MIERVTAAGQEGGDMRVEFTPRFLATGFSRKLYVVKEGRRMRIPPSGRAHAHPYPDDSTHP